jgi:hypothetical protein
MRSDNRVNTVKSNSNTVYASPIGKSVPEGEVQSENVSAATLWHDRDGQMAEGPRRLADSREAHVSADA